MTTLDKTALETATTREFIEAVHDIGTRIFTGQIGTSQEPDAARGLGEMFTTAYLDALSSIPEQGVGVKPFASSGYPTGSMASAADDDQFAARLADGSASLAPSQPAAVGERVTELYCAQYEAVHRAAIDAYEASTPSDQRYSAVALRKAVDAARAIEAALRSAP